MDEIAWRFSGFVAVHQGMNMPYQQNTMPLCMALLQNFWIYLESKGDRRRKFVRSKLFLCGCDINLLSFISLYLEGEGNAWQLNC